MAFEISLAQFNRIASGEYNAGQIDIRQGANGTAELVKINDHVWKTGKNQAQLSPERVLEVKEAFIAALARGGVSAENLREIRARLGIPEEMSADSSVATLKGILKERFKPLSRAEVRSILDQYARAGRGFTAASRQAVSLADAEAAYRASHLNARHIARRDAANAGGPLAHVDGRDYRLTDAISLISTTRPLGELDAIRSRRIQGENAVNERRDATTALRGAYQTLFAEALTFLPAGVRESGVFRLCGMEAKLVKGEDGNVSVVLGRGETATKVNLDISAQAFVDRLIGRAVADKETLGAPVLKSLLGTVYDRDLETGLVASDRTSLTRCFAALILETHAQDAFGLLVKGDYNPGLLVEIAERVLDGAEVIDTKAKLDAYHEKLVTDNAGLPEEMKAMLEQVAGIPLEKPNDPGSEFLVRAPIVADIQPFVDAIPAPPGPVAVVPRDIGGIDGIKDFVADLVFSDETMVSDVVVNRPGETMRGILSDEKKTIALAEILKNPSLLKRAAAPQIADVLLEGFGKMRDILDAAWRAANKDENETLAQAAERPDFTGRFSLFLKDSEKLPGAELAKFDNIIQVMANKGCEKLQSFVNEVFQVNAAGANELGALTSDPYKDKTPEQIKAELDGKTLNDILDSASTSDAPGQVGFFRQVISTYFTQLGKADKRSAFASSLRYAQAFEFGDKKDAELESAMQAALNKFTGAILKGTSPLLQKMMQGLPKEIMGAFSDALSDMKSNLAPIPRKVVQAHLMKMIRESNGVIRSIELERSLGAASVGEAFLCKFTIVENGEEVSKELVVKIMRHDAEERVKAEAEIFSAAAAKIPGMAKTWEGQLRQYMTEFDVRNEAANVAEGVALYGVFGNEAHPLQILAPDVDSMKISTLVAPQKNVMVAEVAPGSTVDSFFKKEIAQIRTAASAVFAQDPATQRILWEDGPEVDPKTGKAKQVPVFKQDIAATSISNLQQWLAANYFDLQRASNKILQATKAWFHEAVLGSGKFHGDTHSGNLMVSGSKITFIDFGNLYKLNDAREDGVNEKTELLWVLMGAAFRDKNFVLKGFEQLMSPEGKAALAANRAKAEAILDSVLDKSKGGFSFNIVYRLQAAVVELQKLGLELPPQINCFIQSLVRRSNTVTEINTIMNQCKAMLDATKTIVQPAPERDDLDIVGKAFDIFASTAGKMLVPEDDEGEIPLFMKELQSERFGGLNKSQSPMFRQGGEYYNNVLARLQGVEDPIAEAERLISILASHGDSEHNIQAEGIIEGVGKALTKFRTDYHAAKTPEEKTAAIQAFTGSFSTYEAQLLQAMVTGFGMMDEYRLKEPKSFASAITSILFDNFTALQQHLSEIEQATIGMDARNVARDELGLGFFASLSPANVVDSIVQDAGQMGGDKDYKVDIGV